MLQEMTIETTAAPVLRRAQRDTDVAAARRSALARGSIFADKHALPLVIGLTAFLIAADYVTGIEFAFTVLYLAPICLAAWTRGKNLGIAISSLCVLCGTAIEISSQMGAPTLFHIVRMVWNQGVAFVVFLFCVSVTWRLREFIEREALERRMTVEQLRQAERLGVVGKLAAGLAHELGTPLNVISGHAELLEIEQITPKTLHATAQTILAQTAKMTSIIRNLMDFSRRGGGDRTAIEIDSLGESAAQLLAPMARKHSVKIEVIAGGAGKTVVFGNRTELEQVIINLMVNGIQAMPKGGTLRVRTSVPERDQATRRSTPPTNFACIEVEDEGSGISPEALPQIFDPFFTTKEVGAGTGLGLSVSYGIVSDHGGRIQVASSIGSGSTFFVYLPTSSA